MMKAMQGRFRCERALWHKFCGELYPITASTAASSETRNVSMSVETINSKVRISKPTGIYLMALRRHVVERKPDRQRLLVTPWTPAAPERVPILNRGN
jgi:hypothetical protein